MIKVIINEKEFELGILTVGQWQKISRFDPKQEEFWPKIISVALGISEWELKGASRDALELAIILISHNMEWGEAESLQVKRLDDMSFGDWIDLDIWYQDGVQKTIHKILERFADGGLQTPMPAALEALKTISSWRRNQFRAYSGLFGDFDDEDREAIEEQEEERPNDSRRIWYDVLVGLSGQDPLKIDQISDMPFRAALNFMAWRKDDNMKQKAEMQKLKNKMKV